MTEQPDLNTGKEWSKNDLFSLRNRIEHGRTVGHIATFLRRTEVEVRVQLPLAKLAARPLVRLTRDKWSSGRS